MFIFVVIVLTILFAPSCYELYCRHRERGKAITPAEPEEFEEESKEDDMKVVLEEAELEQAVREYLESRGFTSISNIEIDCDDSNYYMATVELSEFPKVPSPYRG